MKIALVHDFLVRLGGAERVLKELHLTFPEAPIYTLLYDEKKIGDYLPKENIQPSYLQKFPGFLRRRHKLLFPLMPLAIEHMDFTDYDLVISSSSSYAHGILTSTKTRHICYCHSPMRYAWDWTHRYFDENNLKGFKAKMARKLIHKVRLWDKISADRPDAYLANSIHTQKRIQKYYRLESTVVYPPVDVDRFSVSTTSDDFYLIVSTLAPFKRIDIAVEAFNVSGKKLVIIGDGADRDNLERMAKKNIEFRGFRTDAEVADAMGRCRALIFPGEEDFGITPVEAMACGKPVIAYGKGGLLETVVDGETGVFFREPNVESLIGAVARFEAMSFEPAKIAERAKMFEKNRFRHAIKSVMANY